MTEKKMEKKDQKNVWTVCLKWDDRGETYKFGCRRLVGGVWEYDVMDFDQWIDAKMYANEMNQYT